MMRYHAKRWGGEKTQFSVYSTRVCFVALGTTSGYLADDKAATSQLNRVISGGANLEHERLRQDLVRKQLAEEANVGQTALLRVPKQHLRGRGGGR
jgi:hypothetical protein